MKFRDAQFAKGLTPTNKSRDEYIAKKMRRAIPDIAFIVGKLREDYNIGVLANRRDQMEQTVSKFLAISKTTDRIPALLDEGSDNYRNINPSTLKVGYIIRNMTVPQLWKITSALVAVLSAVAFAAFAAGKGMWP